MLPEVIGAAGVVRHTFSNGALLQSFSWWSDHPGSADAGSATPPSGGDYGILSGYPYSVASTHPLGERKSWLWGQRLSLRFQRLHSSAV